MTPFAEQLNRIEQSQAVVSEQIDDLVHVVKGNGKPGVVANLQTAQTDIILLQEAEKRRSEAEKRASDRSFNIKSGILGAVASALALLMIGAIWAAVVQYNHTPVTTPTVEHK